MNLSESDIVKKITERELSNDAKAEMLGALGIDSRQVMTFRIEVQSDVLKGAMSESLLRKLLKKEGFDSKIQMLNTRQGYIASGRSDGSVNASDIYALRFWRGSATGSVIHILSPNAQGSYCGKLFNEDREIEVEDPSTLATLEATQGNGRYYAYGSSVKVPNHPKLRFCSHCWTNKDFREVREAQQEAEGKTKKAKK